MLALAAGAVTIVFLVTQAFRRWDVLLATIVSMAVLVAAAWIVLSRRGAKRAIAAAVAIVALGGVRHRHGREREHPRFWSSHWS